MVSSVPITNSVRKSNFITLNKSHIKRPAPAMEVLEKTKRATQLFLVNRVTLWLSDICNYNNSLGQYQTSPTIPSPQKG